MKEKDTDDEKEAIYNKNQEREREGVWGLEFGEGDEKVKKGKGNRWRRNGSEGVIAEGIERVR